MKCENTKGWDLLKMRHLFPITHRTFMFITISSISFLYLYTVTIKPGATLLSVYNLLQNDNGVASLVNYNGNYNIENNTTTTHKEMNGENNAKIAKKDFPRSIILWTIPRSGSTFTGELLANALPKTFYSLEPLHYWHPRILHENNTETSNVRRYLRGLLSCSIDPSYVKPVAHESNRRNYKLYNRFFTQICKQSKKCTRIDFVNDVCQQANIHVVKLVRLSLKWAWSLLEDEDLDLHIIYLVRDPRAVLQSRSSRPWCRHKTCSDPKTVCKLLDDDLQEAKKLMLKFPNKFKFVQYENLCDDLVRSLQDIMSFVKLKFSDSQMDIINSEKGNPDNPSTTRKDSKSQLNRWRLVADFSRIWTYQRHCLKPISELGLRIFSSKEDFMNISLPVLLS